MIGLKVALGWLELVSGTLSLEVSSPFFSTDTIPGTLSYPFALALSAGNVRRLNFPHLRADQGEIIAPEPVQLYLDGVLRWVGSLVYLSCDEAAQHLEYHFVADAADLATRLDGVSLPQLDLGTTVLQLRPDADLYALPCLRNTLFYDEEKVLDYGHVINYYRLGAYHTTVGGKRAPIVPFLRLVPLLKRVFAALGYELAASDWLALPEVQQLVIYSDRAAEDAAGNLLTSFALNRHVPNLLVADVLLALQKLFCLGYDFHPVRRLVRLRALRDVVADPAYVDRLAGPAQTTAVTSDGYTLKMELEEDELNKTLDTGWATLVLGKGQTEISTVAGTLHVVREADPFDVSRQWLVPAVEAKGASLAFDQGDDSRCGLRLLFDRGLQADSYSQPYPLATWGQVNYLGNANGQSTLHWDGPWGLYATWHAGWLDFLSRATTKECAVPFGITDLLTLDAGRKELVGGKKYLWEKVALSLPTGGPALASAQFTYRYCRL